jgi:hypothetical protein
MASEKSRLGLSEMQNREFQGNSKLAKTLLELLINFENFFQCRMSCLGFSPKNVDNLRLIMCYLTNHAYSKCPSICFSLKSLHVSFVCSTFVNTLSSRYWFFAGLKKYVAYVFAYTTSAKDIFWMVPGKFDSIFEPERSQAEEDSVQLIANPQSWSDWFSAKFFGAVQSEDVSAPKDPKVVEPSWKTVVEDFRGVEFSLQVNATESKTLLNNFSLKMLRQSAKWHVMMTTHQ